MHIISENTFPSNKQTNNMLINDDRNEIWSKLSAGGECKHEALLAINWQWIVFEDLHAQTESQVGQISFLSTIF